MSCYLSNHGGTSAGGVFAVHVGAVHPCQTFEIGTQIDERTPQREHGQFLSRTHRRGVVGRRQMETKRRGAETFASKPGDAAKEKTKNRRHAREWCQGGGGGTLGLEGMVGWVVVVLFR